MALSQVRLERNSERDEIEQVVRSGVPVADAHLSLGAAYLEDHRVRDAIDILTRGVGLDAALSLRNYDEYDPDLAATLAIAPRVRNAIPEGSNWNGVEDQYAGDPQFAKPVESEDAKASTSP